MSRFLQYIIYDPVVGLYMLFTVWVYYEKVNYIKEIMYKVLSNLSNLVIEQPISPNFDTSTHSSRHFAYYFNFNAS